MAVYVQICMEDTVKRILEKYLVYNSELNRYRLCYMRKPLREDMNLSENGVTLKHNDFLDDFVPTLMLYYQVQEMVRSSSAVCNPTKCDQWYTL